MMLKDSSLVSTITVLEMTRAGQMIASSTFQNMTVYTTVAVLYLLLSLPLVFLIRRLEIRHGKGGHDDRGQAYFQVLRAARSAQGCFPVGGRGGGGLPDRAVRLGQVHGTALHQRTGVLRARRYLHRRPAR
jgi:hypothetical protein